MSTDTNHILGAYQQSLDELNSLLNRMAAGVQQSLTKAVRALMDRDSAACAEVIADDEEINQLEKSIDALGVRIITLYQPVAADLRSIISTMKVSSNLERIGDQAVGIAKRARKMNKNLEIAETRLIEPISDAAAHQLRSALAAYRKGDIDSAVETKRSDKSLDEAYKALAKKLTKRMEENPAAIKDYLDLQFIARFLERVGDHPKNISEDAVYAEAAVDIRHGGKLPPSSSES